MSEHAPQVMTSRLTVKGNVSRVSSTVVAANPVADTEPSQVFTRKDFEGALDKVSRPERTPEKA